MKTYREFLENILNEMASFNAFHGTPTVFGDFEYEHTGKGNDQLGAGFYFTSDAEDAHKYIGDNTEGSNIKPVTIELDKPIILDDWGESTKQRPLTRTQIEKIIRSSPYFDEAIENFGDVEYKGLRSVINEAINSYLDLDLKHQILNLQGDFFKNNIQTFFPVVKKVTGYDGIIRSFKGLDTKHYVIWDKSKIKPLHTKDL